jgi:predicted anti-sigma-YlaC factor YlaD
MDCRACRQTMIEASASEVLENRNHEVTEHLLGCDQCRSFQQELQILFKELETFVIPAPAELYPATLARIAPRKTFVGWRFVVAVGFLGAALAALAASWYFTYGPGKHGFAVSEPLSKDACQTSQEKVSKATSSQPLPAVQALSQPSPSDQCHN